ncbi:uncharacterized protein LOC129588629 [Paramacrobiotus metropolitanus]|uniref:uncharacterized protein LOC129588629 n=1 Tax=Paramacrobiotus metropolitanus TaxID=2943436 RepID=UPI002445FFB8|nr:uncharacterized protein LOC129588629 [Paramacrobiotus metropolitanus]
MDFHQAAIFLISAIYWGNTFGFKDFVDLMQPRLGYYSGMLLPSSATADNNYGFGYNEMNEFPDSRIIGSNRGFAVPESRVLYGMQLNRMSRIRSSCVPNMLPGLDEPGFCLSTKDLDNDCTDREVSASSDCNVMTFDGQWCCYVPPSMGNKQRKVMAVVKASVPAQPASPVQQTSQPVLQATTATPATVKQTPAAPVPQTPAPPPQTPAPIPQTPAPAPQTPAPTPQTPVPPPPPPPQTPPPAPAPSADLGLNKPCNTVNDCPDSGTTCKNGRCNCWMDQGISAARTWSCSDDSTCRTLFPGHICRPTKLCPLIPPNTGYCMPLSASSRMLEDFYF